MSERRGEKREREIDKGGGESVRIWCEKEGERKRERKINTGGRECVWRRM